MSICTVEAHHKHLRWRPLLFPLPMCRDPPRPRNMATTLLLVFFPPEVFDPLTVVDPLTNFRPTPSLPRRPSLPRLLPPVASCLILSYIYILILILITDSITSQIRYQIFSLVLGRLAWLRTTRIRAMTTGLLPLVAISTHPTTESNLNTTLP